MSSVDPFTSWASRVKLLDDFPTSGDPSSDMLGMVPMALSVARSLLGSEGKPMVIHIDGAWGRGKTSFCNILADQLQKQAERINDGQDRADHIHVRVVWYVASDSEPVGQRAVMYQVLRAVLDEDPEEIAALMTQFNLDGGAGLGEPKFDRFRKWLAQELGWFGRRSDITKAVSLPTVKNRASNQASAQAMDPDADASEPSVSSTSGETSGQVSVRIRGHPRKLAVVIVDDLDRCGPQWVSNLLDTMRRYVNCDGVSFVVAADREVIESAFDDVVSRLGVGGSRSNADALEKYIRHRVELPNWSFDSDANLSNKLNQLQQSLNSQPGELPLLKAPTLDLTLGVAYKLALYLPRSLSVRRLKRLLNSFATDIARIADIAEIRPQDLDGEESVWSTLSGVSPRFDEAVTPETFAAHYFGLLIVATLREVWPQVLDLPVDSNEFEQRIRVLQLLGCSIQNNGSSASLALDLFETVLSSVVGNEAEQPGIEVKREVCEFVASVYAELKQDGRFIPRRASFHIDDTAIVEPDELQPSPPVSSTEESAQAPVASDSDRARRSKSKQRLRAEDSSTPADSDFGTTEEIATDLERLLPLFEQSLSEPLPAGLDWLIRVTESMDGDPTPRIREVLRRFAQTQWPPETCFAVREFADGIIQLGLERDAFDLLVRSYQDLTSATQIDQTELRAFRWSLTEVLVKLATGNSTLREKLGLIVDFPPTDFPDCATAWDAAIALIRLGEGTRVPFTAPLAFIQNLVKSLADLIDRVPGFSWPARTLLSLLQGRTEVAGQQTLNKIAERLLDSKHLDDEQVELALATARVARSSHNVLALDLYQKLEDANAFPVSELHSRALLYRDIGDTNAALRCWEKAYRLEQLSDAGRREFQLMLEQQEEPLLRRLVEKGKAFKKDDHRFGALPEVVMDELKSTQWKLATEQSPLSLLRSLREAFAVITPNEGLMGKLVPALLIEANAIDEGGITVEVAEWRISTTPSRATIDIARGMAEIDLYSEARDTLQYAVGVLPPQAYQLKWQLVGAEVEPFRETGAPIQTDSREMSFFAVGPGTPPLGRVWQTVASLLQGAQELARGSPEAPPTAYLAQDLLGYISPGVLSAWPEAPPRWLYTTVVNLLAACPLNIANDNLILAILANGWTNQWVPEQTYVDAARSFLLFSSYTSIETAAYAEEVASRYQFSTDEYLALAHRFAAVDNSLSLRFFATAYEAGERGKWVNNFAMQLPTEDQELHDVVKLQIDAGKEAPDLSALVQTFKVLGHS